MLFLLPESSNILCNHLMYLDYFHIQLVFDLVMDLRKVKYIIIIIIITIQHTQHSAKKASHFLYNHL
jgi:hypothetical protein